MLPPLPLAVSFAFLVCVRQHAADADCACTRAEASGGIIAESASVSGCSGADERVGEGRGPGFDMLAAITPSLSL